MEKENRVYKSSVFADLFYSDADAKRHLAELYNALYEDDVSDVSDIELVRLENTLFTSIHNDVAFLVKGRRVVLIEHQSTVNQNMPLRFLMYIAREYESLLPTKVRYKKAVVQIPVPEFIVFYNGLDEFPQESELRLQDAFFCGSYGLETSLDLTVKMININAETGHPILEKCEILGQYSKFVNIVRKHGKKEQGLKEAVEECLRKGILKDYLERKGSEVVNMLIAEYNYDEDIQVQREEAMEKGIEKGIEKGTLNTLTELVKDGLLTITQAADRAGLSEQDFIRKMRQIVYVW